MSGALRAGFAGRAYLLCCLTSFSLRPAFLPCLLLMVAAPLADD